MARNQKIAADDRIAGPDVPGRRTRLEASHAELVAARDGSHRLDRAPFTPPLFATGTDPTEGDDVIVGTSGNDTLMGAGGNDHLSGLEGDDILNGGDGDDVLDGGEGGETAAETFGSVVYGGGDYASYSGAGVGVTVSLAITGPQDTGLGRDTLINIEGLIGGNGADILTGDGGTNTLIGGDGDDTLYGGAGSDTLLGSNGNDILNGEEGNDFLVGDMGDDTLNGGDGDDLIWARFGGRDTIDGGAGDDRVVIHEDLTPAVLLGGIGVDTLQVTTVVTLNAFSAANGFERFVGAANAGIRGTSGDNVLDFSTLTIGTAGFAGPFLALYGGLGNDTLTALGGASRSVLYGDNGSSSPVGGNDTLIAGAFGSLLSGDGGNDTIWGGAGDDEIYGGPGLDIINAGDGNDRIYSVLNDSADIIDAGAGDDSVSIGGRTMGSLQGGAGIDTLYVDFQSASLEAFSAANGFERWGGDQTGYGISGTDGANVLDFSSLTAVPFAGVLTIYGGDGADVITGLGGDSGEVIVGDGGDDTLYGLGGNDRLIGGIGLDRLYGGDGNDELTGGDDADQLFGGQGDDVLLAGMGNDTVDGGAGLDTASFADVSFAVTASLVTNTSIGSGSDTLISIENLRGSKQADTLTGNAGANVIDGYNGNDTIFGEAGDDTLLGGLGSDGLFGGDGNDTLLGEEGDDVLSGGAGSDLLDGGDGLDIVDYSDATTNLNLDLFVSIFHVAGGTDTALRCEGLAGGSGNDVILGDKGDNVLRGNLGDDVFTGRAGNDLIEGGSGSDTAIFSGQRSAYNISAHLDGYLVSGPDGLDFLRDIELLRFDDQVITPSGVNVMTVITGSENPDVLRGSQAGEILNGRGGNDILIGQGGNDFIEGGNGYDIAGYSGVRRAYVASATSVSGNGEGVDSLTGIEDLAFTDGRLTFARDGQAAQVMRLYDAAFNRAPDQSGFEALLDTLENGSLTLQQLANEFINSTEFQSQYAGLTNQQFVEQLYQFCLNRAGDSGGIATWTAALNGGMSRGEVLLAFSESGEHKDLLQGQLDQGLWVADEQTLQIARLYDATYDRLPDQGGLATWRNALGGGMSLLAIAQAFATAPEFQARYGNLSNQAFVELMYQLCLNRNGDAGGIQTWTDALNGGMSRGEVLMFFSESAEHVALTRSTWLGGVPCTDVAAPAPVLPEDKHDDAGAQVIPVSADPGADASHGGKDGGAQILPGAETAHDGKDAGSDADHDEGGAQVIPAVADGADTGGKDAGPQVLPGAADDEAPVAGKDTAPLILPGVIDSVIDDGFLAKTDGDTGPQILPGAADDGADFLFDTGGDAVDAGHDLPGLEHRLAMLFIETGEHSPGLDTGADNGPLDLHHNPDPWAA